VLSEFLYKLPVVMFHKLPVVMLHKLPVVMFHKLPVVMSIIVAAANHVTHRVIHDNAPFYHSKGTHKKHEW